MATPISRDILNKETNARFWAQTGYKPGQRLDPNNPTDKAKMPVWMDIFRKVKAEADAGTLVTTYDHPPVAQSLADAEVATKAAAIHAETAATSTDPWEVQTNTAMATTATQVAAQKTSEAAAHQPPTVSPKLEQDAAREAAKNPPPPEAPAADHIAHAQAQSPKPPAPPGPPKEVLYKETNARFWGRTHYKPGQRLDMSVPEDRKQAVVWMDIFREVQKEANEGHLQLTSPELPPPPPSPQPPPPRPSAPPTVSPMPPPPPGMAPPMPGGPMRPGMPFPGQMPFPGGMPPQMPRPGMPFPGQMPPPGMRPQMPFPGQMPGGMPMGPPRGAPGPGMRQPVEQPAAPGGPAPTDISPPPDLGAPAGAPSPAEGGAVTVTTEAAPSGGMSTTAKIALVVLGLGVVGAIGYGYAKSRNKPPSRPSRSPSQTSARKPKVIVATPIATAGGSPRRPPARARGSAPLSALPPGGEE